MAGGFKEDVKLTIKEQDALKRILTLTKREREVNELPVTYQDMAETFGITVATVKYYQKNLVIPPPPSPEEYDPEKFLNTRSRIADEALISACEKGNANALSIYYKLTKRLVDKQEVTHSFDASFFTKAILQARRELDAGRGISETQGMGEVPDGFPSLPPQLHLSPGQSPTENSQI